VYILSLSSNFLWISEFLDSSYQVYVSLQDSPLNGRDIVVPTDHTQHHVQESPTKASLTDGVDGKKFYRSLSQLPDKHSFW